MRVIGVGDNVVDKYEHIRTMYPGGNALNFSVYAKQLGIQSAYLGMFGSDKEAEHVMNVINKLEIDISRCRQVDGENGYTRVTIEGGDRIFLKSNRGGVLKTYGLHLDERDLQYIKHFDLVHTSRYSYMEGELDKINKIGVPISFDFSDEFTIEYIYKVAPKINFAFFSCSHLKADEAVNLLKKVYNLGCRIAIATLGTKGALLYNGDSFYEQQAKLVHAVDTLGAGDSFITAFLINYINGYKDENINIEELIRVSLNKGVEFASKTCMLAGAFGYGVKI